MLQPFLHPSRDGLRLLVTVFPHLNFRTKTFTATRASSWKGRLCRRVQQSGPEKDCCHGRVDVHCVPYLSTLGSNLGKQTGRVRPVPSSNASSPRPVHKKKRKHDTPSDARRHVRCADEQWALLKQVFAVLQRAEVLPHFHFAETMCDRPVWAS